ncbi:MAG: ATP-binding cassette domain-containing protein [Tissierellia bacterium]|nr:ATP-binding cassette domain-containing protein [Tissierellia bacterium]
MLRIKNLYKGFNLGTDYEKRIFEDFNLDIKEHEVTAIIGPNGCGKSTLLNIIAGNVEAESGEIEINDVLISKLSEKDRSRHLARVHQDPSMGVSPSLSILENMAIADNKGKKFNLSPLINRNRIDVYKKLLKPLDLGLENMLDTKVALLSGGQRQSLALVMASMNEPKLFLLDEHTAALDPKTSKLVMTRTKKLINESKMTTLMITHNMRDAVEYSDRIIMLNEGRVIFDKASKDTSPEELEAIYANQI